MHCVRGTNANLAAAHRPMSRQLLRPSTCEDAAVDGSSVHTTHVQGSLRRAADAPAIARRRCGASPSRREMRSNWRPRGRGCYDLQVFPYADKRFLSSAGGLEAGALGACVHVQEKMVHPGSEMRASNWADSHAISRRVTPPPRRYKKTWKMQVPPSIPSTAPFLRARPSPCLLLLPSSSLSSAPSLAGHSATRLSFV